jgi:glycosyltransferase involved in cell wall biosynthesis
MDISLVTSLYRAGKYLPAYINHVKRVAAEVRQAGLSIEFNLIANDASEEERALIDAFAAEDSMVRPVYVPRETLYASWNRGAQHATGKALAFWNVDDIRASEGLIGGYQRVRDGCELVYFRYRVIHSYGIYRFKPLEREYAAEPFDREQQRRLMKASPFFMYTPGLYERVGPFDPLYKIVGDFDWCARATDYADFCPLDVVAGIFHLHGGNLSDSGNPLQIAENNVVHLLRGAYAYLKPCPPDLMRETWSKWQEAGRAPVLPEAIETQLWGDGAQETWEQWQRQHQRERLRAKIEETVRYLPKKFIDSTGLRPHLARLGIVKARPPRGEPLC